MFKCGECADCFKTKSGLSQHKRHRHPGLRNLERIIQKKGKGPSRRGDSKRCWSQAEIATMRELVEKHQGKKNYCKLTELEMGTKTAKQISDKIRDMKLRGEWEKNTNEVPREEQLIRNELCTPRENGSGGTGFKEAFQVLWNGDLINVDGVKGAWEILGQWFENNTLDKKGIDEVTEQFHIKCLRDPGPQKPNERKPRVKRRCRGSANVYHRRVSYAKLQ